MSRITHPPRFLILLILWLLILPLAGGSARATAYPDTLDTPYRLVDQSVQQGKTTEKQGALLQAQILYRPQEIPLDSPFKPSLASAQHPNIYYRELFIELRRLRKQFTYQERQYLLSLNPGLAEQLAATAPPLSPAPAAAPKATPSAYARVGEALAQGKITLKEAVLTQAALLFAPEQLPLDSPFRTQAGEQPAWEPCLTGFYRNVHRVFPELTPAERTFLGSLNPDLANIMDLREREALGLPPLPAALPNYPDLTETVVGTNCIVHYTDNPLSKHMILNADFPQKVKVYMDQAIATMAPNFVKAYHEGDGKLHVYVVRMAYGTAGQCVSASAVDARKRKVYIKIHPGIKVWGGADWEVWVRGTVFHEYHHGIQGAYNWNATLWSAECLSVWASCYYAKWWWFPGEAYTWPASIFNQPYFPLWYETGNRVYSTNALAFFLGHRWGGYRLMREWLEMTAVQDDAIKALNSALLVNHATDFRKEYRIFLAALYTKAIPSIATLMPDVLRTEVKQFGKDPEKASILQTGARYYILTPEPGAQGKALITQFTPTPGQAGGLQAFLLKNKAMTLYDVNLLTHNTYVLNFGPTVKEVAFIASDPVYLSADWTWRHYEYSFSVPAVQIIDISPKTPTVVAGQTMEIAAPLDVSGTFPTKGYPFTVQYWLTVENLGTINKKVESLLPPPPVGIIFEVPTMDYYKGKCTLVVQVRLPADSWKTYQVKAAGQCEFTVLPPAAWPPGPRTALGASWFPGLMPGAAGVSGYGGFSGALNQQAAAIRCLPVTLR